LEVAPDTPIEEVQAIISMAVGNAEKLDDIATNLLIKLADHEALKNTSDFSRDQAKPPLE
jgi:hypothetical protein